MPIACGGGAGRLHQDCFPELRERPGFPSIPGCFGHEVSAFLMICLIEELAQRLGEQLLNKAGKSRYGKHTWRATGAAHLGGCGLDVNKIALMGRWFCAVVLHYTRMVPITNTARDFKRAKASEGIGGTVKGDQHQPEEDQGRCGWDDNGHQGGSDRAAAQDRGG